MGRNLVIFLPNWIGDVVMATPALRAIRNHFPASKIRIFGVMKPYVSRILDGTHWIDETICLETNSSRPFRNALGLVRKLRSLPADTVIYMPNSLRPALVGWLSGIPQRVGFARNGRGCLLTTRLPWPREAGCRQPLSAVDGYLRLAQAIGCPSEPPRLELAITGVERAVARQIWNLLKLNEFSQVVMLNLGSANGTARHWPFEHYVRLSHMLVTDPSLAVLIICGPAEEDLAGRIEMVVGHPRVKSMAGQDLSLGVSKACIASASLMVTPDSGPRHIAAAFGVPTVTLSGPIDPRLSRNYHPHDTVLYEGLSCQPCGETVCPIPGHPCMRNLSAERVYTEVLRLLDRKNSAVSRPELGFDESAFVDPPPQFSEPPRGRV